jgi:hypothetical protein
MVKESKSAEEALPYLGAAFFCEKLLREADTTTSAIRMVDTVNLPAVMTVPEKGAALAIPLTLYVMFKNGEARGEREVLLRVINPSRKRIKAAKSKLVLSDTPEAGTAIQVEPILLKWDKEGLYWFEISVAGKIVTRVPLRIRFVPAEPPTNASGT